MVEVTIVPPQPDPTPLSAFHRPHNLEEHLRAFLAKNNSQGWVEQLDATETKTLFDILREWLTHESVSTVWGRKRALEISQFTRKALKRGNALELLARLYGYRYWKDCLETADVHGRVKNLRYGQKLVDFEILDASIYETALSNETLTVREVKKMGDYRSDKLREYVDRFVRQYRAQQLRVYDEQKEYLIKLACKRFYNLPDYQDVKRFEMLREFPPAFHPDRLDAWETQLRDRIASIYLAQGRYSDQKIAGGLREWCITEDVFNEVYRACVYASHGGRYQLRFALRHYGVVNVLNYATGEDRSAFGLVTQNNRIIKVIMFELKRAEIDRIIRNIDDSD